jgi:hypothetical protein
MTIEVLLGKFVRVGGAGDQHGLFLLQHSRQRQGDGTGNHPHLQIDATAGELS